MAATRNRLSPDDLVAGVGAFLAARLAPTERVAVGLSGGRDSVVLTHLLHGGGLAGRLSAIHVHHGLSPNADAWTDFCIEYCARLAIPLHLVRVEVDRRSASGLEAAARQARYAAFAESPAEVLMLAHHRDDQAETLLFNLLRGTGVAGAAAIPDERPLAGRRLLRPLLAYPRAALERYAEAHALGWIEDESNGDTRHARNYLRHEVMPSLARRFPAAGEMLAQAARHFGEADELLAELAAADWLAACDGHGEAPPVGRLRRLSRARLKNLLRYRCRMLGWRVPTAARLDEFARQLTTAGPDRHPGLDLPDGSLRVAGGVLHWLIRK